MKIVNHCADLESTVFRTITSVNQLSLYGAVTEICEEYESCHDRTETPVVRGQSSPSFVPSVIKTNKPVNDDPANEEYVLQRYRERIEKLSQQDRWSKFCTDAGFLTTVEVGQYFMTKDTEEFSQFTDSVACREYTLPRDEEASQPKDWIWGNTKIGPVLEVATCCLHGKYGVEISSWIRISYGLNKLVTNLNNKDQDDKEQETSEIQFFFEEYALKLNASDFASRSKGKAKPQKHDYASSSTRTIPIGERTWTDIEPGEYSLSDCPVSKKLINLLRHGSLPRDNDGAIEFWRIRNISCIAIIGLTKSGRAAWQEEEEKRTDLILQEQFCTSELFKVVQDAVFLILHYRTMLFFPDGFFHSSLQSSRGNNLSLVGWIISNHNGCADPSSQVTQQFWLVLQHPLIWQSFTTFTPQISALGSQARIPIFRSRFKQFASATWRNTCCNPSTKTFCHQAAALISESEVGQLFSE